MKTQRPKCIICNDFREEEAAKKSGYFVWVVCASCGKEVRS